MLYLQLVVFGLVLVFQGHDAVQNKEEIECVKYCSGKIDKKTVCKDTCNDKHLGDLINATQRQNTLSIPGKPTLVSSNYTSISLTWNTTSRIIAVGYILQVQANWTKQSVNEYFPYIKKYHQFNYTNQSVYTVENLQSKTNYKFRVAVLLLNQTSVFSEWSDLIPTNNSCNKGRCGLTNFRIQLSSRIPDKGEEVLNATFHWEPTTESDLSVIDYRYIYIDIYPLSTHDSCRTRFGQAHHETLKKSQLNLTDKDSSFFKFPNRKAEPKRLMYFDCWYQVKIRVALSVNDIEIGSWISHLPECIEVPAKICGCPYVEGQYKRKVIDLDFIPSSVNTTRNVIVSWSNEMWKNDTKVKYYAVFIAGLSEKYVDSVKGMHNYNTTLYDLKYEGTYTILVFAFHSDHCIHDKMAILDFNVKEVKEVCRDNPCADNEICTRADYLGNHKCKCKDGYITLNGTCIDAKPCVPNPCPVNKKCYPKLTGTFECNCSEGFEDVNGTCRDTHPCQSDPCSKNEICYPKKPIGTYGCNCSANFEKVNGTCQAIKESKVTTNTEKIVLSVTIPLVVIIIIAVVVIFWMRSYQKRRLRAVELASVMYRPESVNNYLNNQPPNRVNLPLVSGKGQHFSEDGREVNFLYVPQEIAEAIASGLTNGMFELPPDRFTFRKVIGKGAFGEVFLGEAYGFRNSPGPTKVAIKKLAG